MGTFLMHIGILIFPYFSISKLLIIIFFFDDVYYLIICVRTNTEVYSNWHFGWK